MWSWFAVHIVLLVLVGFSWTREMLIPTTIRYVYELNPKSLTSHPLSQCFPSGPATIHIHKTVTIVLSLLFLPYCLLHTHTHTDLALLCVWVVYPLLYTNILMELKLSITWFFKFDTLIVFSIHCPKYTQKKMKRFSWCLQLMYIYSFQVYICLSSKTSSISFWKQWCEEDKGACFNLYTAAGSYASGMLAIDPVKKFQD